MSERESRAQRAPCPPRRLGEGQVGIAEPRKARFSPADHDNLAALQRPLTTIRSVGVDSRSIAFIGAVLPGLASTRAQGLLLDAQVEALPGVVTRRGRGAWERRLGAGRGEALAPLGLADRPLLALVELAQVQVLAALDLLEVPRFGGSERLTPLPVGTLVTLQL